MGYNLGTHDLKLEFGFDDLPYEARYSEESPLTPTMKRRRPKRLSSLQTAYGQGKTTGQIAKELEAKYKIVETFIDMEEDYIFPLIEDAVIDTTIARMTGQTPDSKINENLTTKIQARFRQDLSNRRFDGRIQGVPTLASIRGVSHLRQKPYAARGSRPSFIDTGMYQRTFGVEVKED